MARFINFLPVIFHAQFLCQHVTEPKVKAGFTKIFIFCSYASSYRRNTGHYWCSEIKFTLLTLASSTFLKSKSHFLPHFHSRSDFAVVYSAPQLRNRRITNVISLHHLREMPPKAQRGQACSTNSRRKSTTLGTQLFGDLTKTSPLQSRSTCPSRQNLALMGKGRILGISISSSGYAQDIEFGQSRNWKNPYGP